MNRAFLVLVVVALVVATGVTYPYTVASTTVADTEDVEVAFGIAIEGVTIGANATNASVTLARSTVLLTTNALWLNNTNATGAYYARVSLHASSGLDPLLTLLEVGIDNGTLHPQVTTVVGVLGLTSGEYVKLEPGSTNRIYVTQLFASTAGLAPSFGMTVTLADEANASAYSVTRMSLGLV